MAATRALRESFTFPAQNLRLGHLGYLLAWLEGPDGARCEAAEAAEKHAMSTSLEPRIERRELQDLVDAWNEARRSGDADGMANAAEQISAVLEPELRHRWELTRRAIEILRADARELNPGVQALTAQAMAEQWYQYHRVEIDFADAVDGPPYVPSPETDGHPAAAGSRYLVHDASDDLAQFELLHYDSELQAEAIGRGEAFKGSIVEVIDESEDGKARPVWVVSDPIGGINRIQEGARVCVIGTPRREAQVRGVQDMPDGSRQFEVEITNLKKAIKGASGQDAVDPADSSWVGLDVGFTGTSFAGMTRLKSQRIWAKDVPGAWLTLSRGAGPVAVIDDEIFEDQDQIDRGMEELSS